MKKLNNKRNVSKNQNVCTQFHMRLSIEERELLEEKANKRGISTTEYVKECTLKENHTNIYNSDTQQAIYNITDILVYKIKQYCTDENFINECKEGAKALWLSLK